VAFFVWTAAHGRLLTMDNLRKRHICIVGWCCMCKSSGESTDHLLLHCDIAQGLWSLIFCLFGLHWVMPARVVDLLACWMGAFRKFCQAVLWGVILLILELMLILMQLLVEWLAAASGHTIHSLEKFLDFCSFS
jgi:hypothetical protein